MPNPYSHLQRVLCKGRTLSKDLHLKHLYCDLPLCFVCQAKASKTKEDVCRFKDCRRIEWQYDKKGRLQVDVSFQYNEDLVTDAPTPQVFNRPITPDVVATHLMACANFLLPILLREKDHILLPNLIRRAREVEYRVTCDMCLTSLFAQSWLCTVCGRELCSDCKNGDFEDNPCAEHTAFSPVTRFRDIELEDAIQGMSALCTSRVPSNRVDPISLDTPPEVYHMSNTRLDHTKFRQIWARGEPLVVTGVHHGMQGEWNPAYFIRRYGSESVTIIDCESEHEHTSTVAEFFSSFGAQKYDTNNRVLKLKADWPPQNNFKSVFPELYAAFLGGVPFQDYTRPDGVCNLAAHFAVNGVIPDLGPKMYSAYGNLNNVNSHGSTRLHLDVTGAVNIMLYAADLPDGSPGVAVWHIFPSSATTSLREFLRGEPSVGFDRPGDPIHDQAIYLTLPLLDLLARKCGVQPYTIYQALGDAVFIPAGCAHQVSNHADAIKIACDFLSVESLQASQTLSHEYRTQRLIHRWPEDVLQLQTTLWHAWNSLQQFRDVVEQELPFTINEGPLDSPMSDHIEPTESGDNTLVRQERKRQKRKDIRKRKAVTLQPRKPGHDCPCPHCPRYFNMHGVIMHLSRKSSHNCALQPEVIEQMLELHLEEFCARLLLLET